MRLSTRIKAIYGVIYPGQERGALEWFRSELEKRGVTISSSTMHRWAHEGVPDDQVLPVEEALEELADAAEKAVRTLQRRIREAR